MPTPSLEEVIALVREVSGVSDEPISAETRCEADLGITGDDGDDLLAATEKRFNVSLSDAAGSLRENFGLSENEYLFSGEGMDWPLGPLFRWLCHKPEPVIRDLTVGKLHEIIVELQAQQSRH